MAKYNQRIDAMGVFLITLLAMHMIAIVVGVTYLINVIIKAVTSLI